MLRKRDSGVVVSNVAFCPFPVPWFNSGDKHVDLVFLYSSLSGWHHDNSDSSTLQMIIVYFIQNFSILL